MKALPWFRMWAEAVDDEKLRLLAFEDRWHFVALLCLKAIGTIDSDAPLLDRRIALKLGLQLPQLEEVKRRLIEVQLIDEHFQPVAWDARQFIKDKKKSAYVYFIGLKTGDVKIGYSKNPWARLCDINSEHKKKFEVLATVRSTSNSEVAVHHLLKDFRKKFEWFERSAIVQAAINGCACGDLETEEQLVAFLRSYDVATTNRAESEQSRADTESESEKTGGERADARHRAARLPEDFSLTEARSAVAARESVDPQRTFDKFCDHWRAASGANARKRDWDAAWRNWCRTEADRGKPRVAGGSIADRIVWRPTE